MRASHAQEVLDSVRVFTSLDDALSGTDLSVGTTAQQSSSIYRILRKPVPPWELSEILRDVTGLVSLVFGREGTGLNNIELGLCDLSLTIPASPSYPTLNVSHAAAIIFYELYTSASTTRSDELADAEVKQRILTCVEKSSYSIGLAPRNRNLVVRAFKTMMGRSGLRAREASLLAGFFRRVSNHLDEKT